jgi:uncharacterized protein
VRIETWLDDRGRRWTVGVAVTRRERRRGLLGLDGLAVRHGLALLSCRSVHTVGMRFPIEVVALDRALVVRQVVRCRPGRVVLPRLKIDHMLEVRVGSGIRPGDRFVRAAQPASSSSTAPEARRITRRGSSPGIEARTSRAAARRWSRSTVASAAASR